MEWIAEQAYYKVERMIDGLEQRTVKQQRHIRLYADRIESKHRMFPLGEVFDISFKPIGGNGGILYLHTLRGVYPYTVEHEPDTFVQAVKERMEGRLFH